MFFLSYLVYPICFFEVEYVQQGRRMILIVESLVLDLTKSTASIRFGVIVWDDPSELIQKVPISYRNKKRTFFYQIR
jgi:hypothetical protein